MKYTLNKKVYKPFFHIKNNIIVEVNKEFINLVGYSGNELIGKSLIEISSMLRVDSKILSESGENVYNRYIFTKSCDPREVTISCELSDSYTEKMYFFKEKPNSRIEGGLMYAQHLYEDNKNGIAIYSFPDLILLKANEKLLDFLPVPYNKKENSIGRKLKELTTEFEGSNEEEIYSNIGKTGKSYYCNEFKYNHVEKGITYWDLSIVPMYIEKKVKYLIVTAVEVTEKVLSKKFIEEQARIIKQQQKQLETINEDMLAETQYNFFNSMIDKLDLPVLKLSYPDFKIIDINQKAYNFIKRLKPEIDSISFVKGQNYLHIIADFDKIDILRHVQDTVEKKEVSYLKNKRLIVSGKEIFVNVLYQPIFGLNGEIIKIVAIVMDVTEEVKANVNMEKTLKMQEELFANISHELKTPLNIIFSTAELFQLYLKNDSLIDNKDKIINGIYAIRKNCYRLSKLVDNVLDLSKIEAGFSQLNLSNENIVTVVEGIIESVSEYVQSKGLTITFDTDTEEKIVACDINKIEKVMLNLISNAIKFSHAGDEIYVDILDKGNTVEISVRDSGIGIDKNYLDIIFERFKQVDKSFTRNAEGSGIGLCLVKSIVELHNGKISVESKLGEGSKFKIELPSKSILKAENSSETKMININAEMVQFEFSDIYS